VISGSDVNAVRRQSGREKSMAVKSIRKGLAAGAIGFILFAGCSKTRPPEMLKVGANVDLAGHSKEFKQEVIRVTDGVYVAVGFGLANSVLLEGSDGTIIVDTMESEEAAVPVKEAFDRITSKPVKAIIYTHNHADHIFGAKVFVGDDRPGVYSHESTLYYIDRVVNVIRPIIFKRSMRQFGTYLPPGGLINAGIGPRLVVDNTTTAGLVLPNKTFSGESLDLEIAGLKLELLHAPGETNDQIVVWMPEKRVLIAADNYYKSFPNLYAIRGTPYRDVTQWVKSLDKMRALRAEYLVPCHSRPLTGEKKIYAALTNYRDAIQYVHDQTVRGMNEGLTPDELVERVKLPPRLARVPYLHEYYGTVAWSVRSIFDGYLGWFSGNPTDLFPLPLDERAERFAQLAGGEDALLEQARKASKRRDHQWVLELTDQLLRLRPQSKEALELRASALKSLGGRQTNACARNYYLTKSLEVQNMIEFGQPKLTKELVHSIPLRAIFDSMAVKLDPVKSADTNTVTAFRFPDVDEAYTVHVRGGVAEVRPGLPDDPDITITVDSKVWKEIAAKIRNPALAYARGDVKIEGGALSLVGFLGLFED